MLTHEKIQELAGDTVYGEALKIWAKQDVKEITGDLTYDGKIILNGVVRENSRYYNARVFYDVMLDAYEYGMCTCTTSLHNKKLCRHCAAVLLDVVSEGLEEEYPNLLQYAQESGAALNNSIHLETTDSMKSILEHRSQTRLLPLEQSELYGKVTLEPTLTEDWTDEELNVSFKVGVTQKYVVKDVLSFADAVEQGKNVRYGKKLEFIHDISVFTEKSQPLVRFLMDWAKSHRSRYVRYDYYYYLDYPVEYEKVRMIPCDKDVLDDLFDAAGDGILYDGQKKKVYSVYDDRMLKLKLTGTEQGLSLHLDVPKKIAVGRRYLNFMKPDKIRRVPLKNFASVSDFLECLLEEPDRSVYIQKEDLPQFCRELYPAVKKSFRCEVKDFKEEDYETEKVSFEFYLDMPQQDWISCEVLGVYGEKKYSVYDKSEDLAARNMYEEIEAGKIAGKYFTAFDDREQKMFIDGDEDKIYELLAEGIPKLQSLGEVFISDRLKKLQVESSPHVRVGVSVNQDGIELTMLSEDMSNEQLLEILSKYTPRRKYFRLKDGNFVSMEGDGIKNLAKLQSSMNLTTSQMKREKIILPKYRALYMDSLLQESHDIAYQRSRNFKSLIRNMKTVEENDFDIPEELEPILREYQKEGFLWIKTLNSNGFAGILADDMGLGKTLQVIAFLVSQMQQMQMEEDGEKGALFALIVTPASLVYNWEGEIQRFAPDLKVAVVAGRQEQREEILRAAKADEILVTSYDLLKRDIEMYTDYSFRYQIIDEAQYIKNQATQAAKAVKCIRSGFHLALTGTPIENRLSELWSIFDYLMPGFLYQYKKFRDRLEVPIVQNQDEEAVTQLQKMVHPFVLRRLKVDVLKDLPDKLEENYFAKLEGEQRELYDAHVKRMHLMLDSTSDEEFSRSKIQILSELTKLRQICCDPSLLFEDYKSGSAKLDMCMELVGNAVSGGHKILIFSQFTSMLERIQKRLGKEKISYFVLTGSTDKRKRRELVERFNEDETSVFCISLKAGGTGLNLTAADIVIHYDPWWNEAVQEQATDRAHRIGQKNVVNVYRLLAKGTIEERIMEMQEKKKALSDQILTGDGLQQNDFSREELLELLS